MAVLSWVKALASLILADALLASLFGRSGLVLAHLSLINTAHAPLVVTRLVVIANPLACLLGTEERGKVATIAALDLATILTLSGTFHLEILLNPLPVAFLGVWTGYGELSVDDYGATLLLIRSWIFVIGALEKTAPTNR